MHLEKCHRAPLWICQPCWRGSEDRSQFEFAHEDEWQCHMQSKHRGQYKEDNLIAIAKASLRKAVPPIACPLCHDQTTLLQPERDKHIAEHLHSFAFEALPWESIGPDDDTKTSLGSDHNQPVAVEVDAESERSQEGDEDVWIESYDLDELLQTIPESCERIESELSSPKLELLPDWALSLYAMIVPFKHACVSIGPLQFSSSRGSTSPACADIATQLAYLQNLLTMIENLNMTTDTEDPEMLRTLGTLQQDLGEGQEYLAGLIQLAKAEL